MNQRQLSFLLFLGLTASCATAPGDSPVGASAESAPEAAATGTATTSADPAEQMSETPAGTAAAEPLTAEEAVRLALERSGDLSALAYESAAARESSGAAGALPAPEARLAIEALPLDSPHDGEEWLVGVSQSIPLGDGRQGERDAAAAAARAADARRAAAASQTERRVRAVHAAGLAQDQVLNLLRERHRLAAAQLTRARARVAAGEAAPAELDAFLVAEARIEHDIEDAKHAREAQTRELAATIGFEDAHRPLAGELGEAFDLPALEEILSSLGGLPAMQEAAAAAALADARARVAAASQLPLLRLDAGWRERSDGRGSVDLEVGFTIPWSGPAGARSRAAELGVAAQRARSIHTERELARAVADAHDAAVLAMHRLEIQDQVLVPAAERGLARTQARVAAGQDAPAATAAAHDALLSAQLERLALWADLAAAWAGLGALLIRAP